MSNPTENLPKVVFCNLRASIKKISQIDWGLKKLEGFFELGGEKKEEEEEEEKEEEKKKENTL